MSDIEHQSGRGGGGKKYLKGTLALAIVAGLGWVVVSYIARAEIIINPHKETISFNDVLVASRASTTPDNTIGFQIMTVKDEITTSVPATKKEAVTIKATGTIMLYNLTSAAQKLVSRTRLETSGGKLYRITKDTIIPAAKIVSGKSIPGSVEVNAEAALPGAEYNIGLSDFTIPGFKNSAKYSKFYGRSKTKMDGGFIGDKLIASNEALASARVNLKSSLADSLAKKSVDSLPPGWIMYKDGTFLDLAETQGQKPEPSGQGSVTLSESGTLMAIILNEEDLRAYGVNHKLHNPVSSSYKIQGLEDLAFTISNRNNFLISSSDTFTFSLKGPATLVAEIPIEPLKADLAGKAYTDRAGILTKYAGIETAQVKLFPGFITHFPSSKDKITVKVNTVQ